MVDKLEELEVVYYTGQLPHNLSILTFLGLIFDRVHFPHVYIPVDGFDPEWVDAEITRLEALPAMPGGGYDRWLLIQLLKYALTPELREFCHFASDGHDAFGADRDSRVVALVKALYEQVHGVRENFEPMFKTGCSKGLGDQGTSINYPGSFYYQSRALIYSTEKGIPLINADSNVPVPALEAGNPKHNAKLLAAFMAMECASMVMPEMGELQPAQILEARADLKEHVHAFRLAMLRMAAKLSAAIESNATAEDISAAARFIAQTEVYPTIAELRSELSKPRKGWMDRSWKLIKVVPSLVTAYSTANLTLATKKIVEALGDWVVAGIAEKKPRSDFYYLLKLEQQMKVKAK
jgi:hypothetical protein